MSDFVIKNADFVNSRFVDLNETMGEEIKNEPFNRFFSLFYQIIVRHEKCTIYKTGERPSFNDVNKIIDDSFNEIPISNNKLYLMPSVVRFYKSWLQATDKMICFDLVKKMISLGLNINGVCFYRENAFSPDKKASTLDLIIADEKPCLSLINMLVINGGLFYSEKTNENEIKLKNALNDLFNRVKPFFIGHIDKKSILNAIPKEMIYQLAYHQIWVEANTFRAEELL